MFEAITGGGGGLQPGRADLEPRGPDRAGPV
jgi:hypothetical protein